MAFNGQDMKQEAKPAKPQPSSNDESPEEKQLQRDLEHLDLVLVKVCLCAPVYSLPTTIHLSLLKICVVPGHAHYYPPDAWWPARCGPEPFRVYVNTW